MKHTGRRRRRSRKFAKKVFSCSTTMFVCFFSSNQTRAHVNTTRRGEGGRRRSHALFVCLGLPVLRGYVAARRGEREEMQDAHVLLPDMSGCLSTLPGNV